MLPTYEISYDAATDDQSAIVFSTPNFIVNLDRENQIVPGILKIVPRNETIKNWASMPAEYLAELNKTQRLCELLLIQTFHSKSLEGFKEEEILINAYAREIQSEDNEKFEHSIYPRFAIGQKIMIPFDPEQTLLLTTSTESKGFEGVVLSDLSPGKPFEYAQTLKPSLELYSIILNSMRANLAVIQIPESMIKDGTEHAKCFNCNHPKNHVDQAGLMQVNVTVDNEVYTFNLSLDARDQTYPGRGYVIPQSHTNALRYTSDTSFMLLHLVANSYQRAAEIIFNEAKTARTYDRAILMNLFKIAEGGPHVHLHMVPRAMDESYALPYAMKATKYIPLTPDPVVKKAIVDSFANELHQQIINNAELNEIGKVDFSYLAFIVKPSVTEVKGTMFSDKPNTEAATLSSSEIPASRM